MRNNISKIYQQAACIQTQRLVYLLLLLEYAKRGAVVSGQGSVSSEQPMPNVPVKIGISVKGFDRFFTVTTDNSGNFSYTFTPGPNEAGLYSVWAIHPDLSDRSVQAQFAIIGMEVSPQFANIRMLKNNSYDIPVTIRNFGGTDLTGLTLTASSGTGITATAINSGDDRITPGESQAITFRLTSSATASDTGYASLTINTAEGLNQKVEANITLVSALPIINTTPSYIDTGLVRGTQKIQIFTITNTGLDTLKNARLEGPNTSWMSLTVDKTIGDIPANQSKSIGIMIRPGETVAQGVYDDRITIYSDNHIPYTFNIQVTVTSSAVGNVLFDVIDELMEDVSGASITVQHQSLPELIYSIRTAADGTVSQFDIPEGRYAFNITATGHKPTSGTFTITPGITTKVPIALELNMVSIEWSVVPTTIQDKYEIKITQTFETNVPAPVLITEPPSITLPDMQLGQVFNGEFSVTNYGLIAVDDVKIEFPTSFGEYDVEILTSTIPKRIGAMQKITVPYRITRRLTVGWAAPTETGSAYACNTNSPSPLAGEGWGEGQMYAFNSELRTLNSELFNEVQGYGGGVCLTSFTIKTKGTAVICPNTPQQKTVEKDTYYTIGVPISCPSGTGTGGTYTGASGGGGGGYVYTGGSGTGGQGGGGSAPGGSPATINTGNPCDCKQECDKCDPGDGKKVCVNRSCKRVDLSSVDAKANGKDIELKEFVPSEPVSFTSTPIGENCEYVYQWSFGDGTTSTEANPSHFYMRPGHYNISLSVSCKKCSPPAVNDSVSVTLTPGICQEETGQYKPDGSVANDGEQCCYDGQGIPNAPITELDQCPNRVQKPGYDPWAGNGCGGATGLSSNVPNNPMALNHTGDPLYSALHTGEQGNFLTPCNGHDACYGTCKSNKDSCDSDFYMSMKIVCYNDYGQNAWDFAYFTECLGYARLYYEAVSNLGSSWYKDGQKEACNCCY